MIIFKGFKFGMLLQFAIGPVCLLVFSLASNKGFFNAEKAVMAVVLVDAIYIVLALLGMVTFIQNEKNRKLFKLLGSFVVLMYGIQTIIGFAGWKVIPNLSFFKNISVQGPFLQGLILTASNPLTILFWAGVLSTKVVKENLSKKDTYLFGFGCILATLLFLSLISLIGSFTKYFLPNVAIVTLNVMVGFVLIYFSLQMLIKKD